MNLPGAHVSDQDLILHLDNELPIWRGITLSRHLSNCPQCRDRQTHLQEVMTGLSAAILVEGHFPGGSEAEATLRLRMHEPPKPRIGHLHLARLTAALAIGLALIGATLALRTRNADRSTLSMPNRILTPGSVVPVSRERVCAATEAEEAAGVSTALAITVFNHYGIRNPQSRAYEVDYLITPALGGAKDVRNLWPQPYSTGVWNSRIKDALEDRLRAMVCAGDMDLQQAQQELAHDWIASYKRLFQTEHPLPEHRAFIKDPAWE